MRSTSVRFPHAPQYTMMALKESLQTPPKGWKVDSIDDAAYTVQLKTGMSAFSWGERVTIRIFVAENGGTILEINSSPKLATNIVDGGKNTKNLQTIIEAVQERLVRYPPIGR